MAIESMESLVKRAFEEICEKNKDLHIDQPFTIVVYDPIRPRSDGLITTRKSLTHSVQTLFMRLQNEPQSIGEILFYKPRRRVVYQKKPN